ncbi:MAG: histidine kinase [Bacteroidota bacterium]
MLKETTLVPHFVILLALMAFLGQGCEDPDYKDYRPDEVKELSEQAMEQYIDTGLVFSRINSLGDKERLDSLITIAEQIKDFDEESALIYAEQAYNLATARDWEVARGISAHMVGFLKSRQSRWGDNVETAMVDAKISQRLLRDKGMDLWDVYNDELIGYLHFTAGEVDSATYFFDLALSRIASAENPSSYNKQKAILYHHLANTFFSENKNESSKYYAKSDSLYNLIGDTKSRSFLSFGWATLYSYYDEYDKADSMLANCIGVGRLTNNNALLAEVYRSKGLIEYYRLKETEEREFLDRGINNLRTSFNFGKNELYRAYELMGYTYNLGSDIFVNRSLKDSALRYFSLAIEEGKEAGTIWALYGTSGEILSICFDDTALCSAILETTGPEYVHAAYKDVLNTATSETRTAYSRINSIEQRDLKLAADRKTSIQFYIGIGIIGFLIMIFLILYQQQQNKRLQARMVALRAQINPHFISNSLNAIESLINHDKKEQAGKYLIHFSRLSRQILNSSATSTVSLTAELKTLEHFLALEELRFKGKLDYDIAVQPGLNSDMVEVPAMILQPFIENSIWHGIKPKPDGGFIMVEAKREEDVLLITIEDDGIGREKAAANKKASPIKQKSMGMEITAERIKAAGKVKGPNVSFVDLKNDDGSARGTKVIIRMPYKLRKQVKV